MNKLLHQLLEHKDNEESDKSIEKQYIAWLNESHEE